MWERSVFKPLEVSKLSEQKIDLRGTPASQDRMVLEDKLMTNKSVHNERKGKAFKTHLRVLRNVLIVFM